MEERILELEGKVRLLEAKIRVLEDENRFLRSYEDSRKDDRRLAKMKKLICKLDEISSLLKDFEPKIRE